MEEVTGGSGAETGEESASTLVGNDLLEATKQTTVVGDGIKLDPGLDARRGRVLGKELSGGRKMPDERIRLTHRQG